MWFTSGVNITNFIFTAATTTFSKDTKVSKRFIRKMAEKTKEKKFKFAAIQLMVTADKDLNLENARKKIAIAAKNGAKVITLPEMFNCPYANSSFPVYAEEIPNGKSTQILKEAAATHKIYLIGGSIPERENDKLYNTCSIFGPDGTLLSKHRKVHLFDIDIPGQMTFKESDTLSAGEKLTTFDTDDCKIGVGICYDIRFPEYAQELGRQGCKFLVYPGAFNMVTGPVHWELLQRGRALDNQLWVATASPARNPESTYQAWGHSSVVNPWGEVVGKIDSGNEDILYAEIDLDRLDQIRNQIPVLKQKRLQVYQAK